jgi:hypothetical protein
MVEIFISWSGDRSKRVAQALHEWLPYVHSEFVPWVSSEDIDAGTVWSAEILEALDRAKAAIICVTPDNFTKPWLLFEAGAVAKKAGERAPGDRAPVISYVFGARKTELSLGPLNLFQAVDSDREGTRDAVKSLLGLTTRAEAVKLDRLVEKWWPDLEARLESASASTTEAKPRREDEDKLNELLAVAHGTARAVETLVALNKALLGNENPDALGRMLQALLRHPDVVERIEQQNYARPVGMSGSAAPSGHPVAFALTPTVVGPTGPGGPEWWKR